MYNITFREFAFLKKHIEETLKISQENTKEKCTQIYNFLDEKFKTKKEPIDEKYLYELWSKKGEVLQFKPKTINALVQIVDCKNWKEYQEYLKSILTDDILFDPNSINVSDLKENEELVLGWVDEFYFIKIKYLGNNRFEVLDKKGKFKHKKGDIFDAKKFILKYPYKISNISTGYAMRPTICASRNENQENMLDNYIELI